MGSDIAYLHHTLTARFHIKVSFFSRSQEFCKSRSTPSCFKILLLVKLYVFLCMFQQHLPHSTSHPQISIATSQAYCTLWELESCVLPHHKSGILKNHWLSEIAQSFSSRQSTALSAHQNTRKERIVVVQRQLGIVGQRTGRYVMAEG